MYGSAAISLLVLGVALSISLRLLDHERLWRWNLIGLMIRLCTLMVYLMAFIGILWGLMGFLSIFYVVALLVIWAAIYARGRRSGQNALLGLMSVASERNLSLIPCMEAFAQEESGTIGRKADQLAEDLAAGMPLDQAVQVNRGVLPRGSDMAIAVGRQVGSMGQALRELSAVQFRQDELREAISVRLLMLCMLLTVASWILTFVLYKIVPSIKKIFDDFDSELPPMTQMLIDMANALTPLVSLIGMFTVLLLIYAMLNYIGWAPSPGWVRRQFERGRVLRALALGAERQTPLPEVLATLTNEHPTGMVWFKLRLVEDRIRKGADWCDSLRSCGLLRAGEAAILRAAERAGNLPWALREVASRAEERLLYRMQVVLQVVSPIFVVLLGGIVGFIVIAFFLPLVKLISGLT